MNRHLVTVIAAIGTQSRCDAVRMAQAGLHAPVAPAYGFGRERDDNRKSGEGPG